MLGNDFVLRSVLGAGKVHSVVGPNITIGRDTGSRIVSTTVRYIFFYVYLFAEGV